MNRTVTRMLREAAQKNPTTNYVLDKNDSGYVGKTYPQVDLESDWLASALIDLGIKKYDNIAILSEGRGNWIVGEFGIIKAGAQAVPLSVKLTSDEILFRLNHSSAKGIIISKNNFSKLLPIWSKLDLKTFRIVFLDQVDGVVADQCEQTGILRDQHLLQFDALVERGKNSFTKNQQTLKELDAALQEDDVVTISYTSGTTGNPKGIMLTQLNYFANSTDAAAFFNIEPKLRLLITLPLDHAFAHTVAIFVALLKGLSIYFIDSRGSAMAAIKNLPINMLEVKPNFMLTVPTLSGNFMNKMIEGINKKGGIIKAIFNRGLKSGMIRNGDGVHQASVLVKALHYIPYIIAEKLIFTKLRQVFGGELQYCVGGGALLDIRQQKFFLAIGIPIFQGYGLTEAAPVISSNTPQQYKLGTSGMIMPTIQYRIVRTDGTDAPKGEKGELVIKAENVMKGYFNNPKASAESLRDGWLFTGDLGYIDEDNFLMIVGREKALLISSDGEKYSPEEIEEAIVNCGKLVSQVMLYNDHSKYTTAIVTLDMAACEQFVHKHKSASPETLAEAIRKSFLTFKTMKEYAGRFPEKWIPTSFMIVEGQFTEQNQLMNSTLKMVRHKIKDAFSAELEYSFTAEGGTVKNAKNLAVLKKLFF